ncbi:family 20 glycosylhydrolase [Lysobacter tyrosinilyticus]
MSRAFADLLRPALALMLLATAASSVSASTPAPVIPLPAKVTPARGALALKADAQVVVPSGDLGARNAADYFVGLIGSSRGTTLKITESPGSSAGTRIRFITDASAPAGDEAYAVSVTPTGAQVRARSSAGLFYGGITLWQLMTADGGNGLPVSVPATRIEDAPRFTWRGFMLDSARHMQSVDEIKRLLDQMAQAKLNVFHWHLTDDQGWRLEIKRYPRLTDVGSWRIPAGKAGRDARGKPVRYGGYYTQAQAREVVAYAAQRHITVVPEIELPGHAQAAIAAYPQFGVTGKAPVVSADWGVHPYLYNTDDATFAFLENVLGEVMAVFPGTYIHIGGDEAVKAQWTASPRVQAQRRALGLADEQALQSWFIKRIERFIVSRGRKLIGWDEILEGGLPPEATVMSWRGIKGAVEAAKQGHDVVLSPSNLTYFNRMQGDGIDEPPSHDYPTPLRAVYDFEPIPGELSTEEAVHVLGTQANLWTEHVRTEPRVEHMAFPRLAALAEIAWSPREGRNWDSFLQRLAPQMQRYRAAGIAAADSAFAVRFDIQPADAEHATVGLSNQVGFGELRYTLDGSAPTAESPRYERPLAVALQATVRANAFFDGRALAGERKQDVTAQVLRTAYAEQLQTCSKGLVLRLEDDEPTGDQRAVVPVDITDPCVIWTQVDLTGASALRVDAVDLPFNFQFGTDPVPGQLSRQSTRAGEIEVRLDGCQGQSIGTASMGNARRNASVAVIDVPIAAAAGRHDLCLRFTRDRHGPFWALDRVQLLPEAH